MFLNMTFEKTPLTRVTKIIRVGLIVATLSENGHRPAQFPHEAVPLTDAVRSEAVLKDCVQAARKIARNQYELRCPQIHHDYFALNALGVFNEMNPHLEVVAGTVDAASTVVTLTTRKIGR